MDNDVTKVQLRGDVSVDTKNDLEKSVNMSTKDDDVSEKSYTENQLQREIDELDEALDELAANKKVLQDKQNDRKKQIMVLEKEIKK